MTNAIEDTRATEKGGLGAVGSSRGHQGSLTGLGRVVPTGEGDQPGVARLGAEHRLPLSLACDRCAFYLGLTVSASHLERGVATCDDCHDELAEEVNAFERLGRVTTTGAAV